ncbi:MAG: hypothetical protein ACR2NW_09250 [Thermodesulfobacteriota bacterium]
MTLKELDCNCNGCKHLQRSLVGRQQHIDFHYRMQKDSFDTKRIKLLDAAEKRVRRGEKEKAKLLIKEARKMAFVFDMGTTSLHYGKCLKFGSHRTFIQGVCQLDTQHCFKLR